MIRLKKSKSLLAVLLALTLVVAVVSACATDETTSTAPGETTTTNDTDTGEPEDDTLEPIDVTFYLWGPPPNDLDLVLDTFHESTQDILNLTISMDWTPLDDFGNRIRLRLSAGESVDAAFDAQWLNMLEHISQGNYRDLSGYFLNDDFPGLRDAFDADLLGNNMFGTGKTYGIPLTQSFGVTPLVFLRGDLRQQYGLDPVVDPETYRAFLDAIVENEPTMIPYAMAPARYHVEAILNNEEYRKPIDRLNQGVWEGIYAGDNVSASFYVDDYQIVAAALNVEPESARADFPAPYDQWDLEFAEIAREWYEKGYIDADVMTVDDPEGQFTAGRAASVYWDAANYNTVENSLALSQPDSVLETYMPNPTFSGNMTGMKEGSFQAWNFICIPVTTSDEKTDRIMMFYDWLYSSRENHDLIEYGVENKHFVPEGDMFFSLPEGTDPATNYSFPGYQLTWNPNFVRISADLPDEVAKYVEQSYDPDTYYNPLFSGFSFNPDPVSSELSNPDFATFSERMQNINYGVVPDVRGEFDAISDGIAANANLMEDIAVIKAELISQAQAYLDERKVFDEENNIVYPE